MRLGEGIWETKWHVVQRLLEKCKVERKVGNSWVWLRDLGQVDFLKLDYGLRRVVESLFDRLISQMIFDLEIFALFKLFPSAPILTNDFIIFSVTKEVVDLRLHRRPLNWVSLDLRLLIHRHTESCHVIPINCYALILPKKVCFRLTKDLCVIHLSFTLSHSLLLFSRLLLCKVLRLENWAINRVLFSIH